MNAVAQLERRPMLSADFIERNRRNRVVRALAECICEKGYRATHVADVVSQAGIARNTFYETFSSKADVASALLATARLPERGEGSIGVLALEAIAPWHVGDQHLAVEAVEAAQGVLNLLADYEAPAVELSTEPDPELCILPPGRHGLHRNFVRENQRKRLLLGMAAAVHEHGAARVTVGNITQRAHVSRRSFYEHFLDKGEAIEGLISYAEKEQGLPLVVLDFDSGLGELWVEIAAAYVVGDEVAALALRATALEVLATLAERFEAEAAS